MKRRTIIILCVLIVVLAGAMYAYREYNRTNPDLTNVRSEFTVSAPALISEFEANDSIANSKYLGKVITVQGVLKEVKAEDNNLTVLLGDTSSMSSVRCAMDSAASAAIKALAEGTAVSIKGNCTGFNKDELLGSDVILNRCVVAKD